MAVAARQVAWAFREMAAQRLPACRGRTSDREALDRLLENVRGGQSAALVIRGEARAGKTALLRYAARQAAGFFDSPRSPGRKPRWS